VGKSFTLIEILIIVAIVAMLLAVVLPALAQVRARAQESACASNLRQLSCAALQYTADHDGSMPLTSHSGLSLAWGESLCPYGVTPTLRLCPSDPQGAQRQREKGTSYA
jgi:type II secretory pathway pseudopilin PulG